MIVIKGDIWFTIGGDGAKKKQVGQNVLGLPAGESLTRFSTPTAAAAGAT